MHARVTTVTITGEKRSLEPASLDEAIAMWDQKVAEVLPDRKGFVEATLLVCRKTNRIMQVGLWETEEDMMQIEEEGIYDNLVGKFCDIIGHQPRRPSIGLRAASSPARRHRAGWDTAR